MGSAFTLPRRGLKRVTVCPDDLTGTVKPAGTECAGNWQHNAIKVKVVELAEPNGKDERNSPDDRHRNPREIKEKAVQVTIHEVSPFGFAGRLSFRLSAYIIVELNYAYKIKMRIITKRFKKGIQ